MDLRAGSLLKKAWAVGLLLGLAAPGLVWAQEGRPGDCYDVMAEARILEQVYTPIPDCGDGCIVMRWPWLLDFDVRRVRRGVLPTGPLRRVQSVQHTYIRDDRLWRIWLRRNSIGGYDLVGLGSGGDLERCHEGAKPARPYDGRLKD